jgi:osmotically inducible protein OsmC
MDRKAWAIWQGNLREGRGKISTETGVLKEAPYGFKARFENGPGTNPEELIGAAHAACYAMAMSLALGEAGLTPEHIETHATVSLEKSGDGFEITSSALNVSAKIPGATPERFQAIAAAVKLNCPVSKLLKAKVSLEARLIE